MSTQADALFAWQGIDPNGNVSSGELSAPSKAHVRVLLTRQSYQPTHIIPINPIRKGNQEYTDVTTQSSSKYRLKTHILVMVTRQLATLIHSGLPLLQAIQTLSQGTTSTPVKYWLQRIHHQVASGKTLHRALKDHGGCPPLYSTLIEIGEASGTLEIILQRLAVYLERQAMWQRQIRMATIYPLLVLGTSVCIIVLFMLYVVPAFADIYAGAEAPLPFLTQWILGFSQMVVNKWFYLCYIILLFVLLVNLIKRTKKGRYIFYKSLLYFPILGKCLRQLAIARWSRTISVMLNAGIPVLETISPAAASTNNPVYIQVAKDMQTDIAGGLSFAKSMPPFLFDSVIRQMINIGEESGNLGFILEKFADYLDESLQQNLQTIMKLMEPLIVLLLGILVGGIVLALYLPVFQIGRFI